MAAQRRFRLSPESGLGSWTILLHLAGQLEEGESWAFGEGGVEVWGESVVGAKVVKGRRGLVLTVRG